MTTTPRSLVKIYAQVKGTKKKKNYDIFIGNGKSPICCNKWKTKLGGEIQTEKGFTKTMNIQEIKVKQFQIRLLHRILVTDIVLNKMGIPQCALCDFFFSLERNSVQRCTWGCEHVKYFWSELQKFIYQECQNIRNFKFNEKTNFVWH